MKEVCTYLLSTNLGQCCIDSYFSEKGRSIKLVPRVGEEVKFLRVDGCIIKSGKKCDCLVLYKRGKSKLFAVFAELKGGSAKGSYNEALTQLENTIKHSSIATILDSHSIKTVQKRALILAGKGMMINRPSKEEAEENLGVRLHLQFADQDDKAFNLRDICN